jgi:hypothetical protein
VQAPLPDWHRPDTEPMFGSQLQPSYAKRKSEDPIRSPIVMAERRPLPYPYPVWQSSVVRLDQDAVVQCPSPIVSAKRTDAVWSPSPKFKPLMVTDPNWLLAVNPLHVGMFIGAIFVATGGSYVKPLTPVPTRPPTVTKGATFRCVFAAFESPPLYVLNALPEA